MIENQIEIYLKEKNVYVSKRRMAQDLNDYISDKKISQALRKLRKEGKVKYGLRRWGWNYGTK